MKALLIVLAASVALASTPREQLITHLSAIGQTQVEARARVMAGIQTRAAAEQRKILVREKIRHVFSGTAPDRGSQEAEQTIPNFLAEGLDFGDWIELAATKPYAVVSTTSDMFPIKGAGQTYEEVKRIYGLARSPRTSSPSFCAG